MSIDLVENEIRRFLATDEAEVICIIGHWGVGKTFAWNRYLKDAQEKSAIALKRYSYVSLFGVNSLDELKYSIFENAVRSSEVGLEPSLETLDSNTAAAAEQLGRKSLWFLQQIPVVKNYIGGLGPVWFMSVKKMIICIDDIERRGKTLPVRDVLGLISNLKEHKGCKVCLILNDEALEEDQVDFRRYLEKVVDTSLRFAPSPAECVRIALTRKGEVDKALGEYCIALGISNIRLIKRIERSVRKVEPMLGEFHKQVLRQAVQSLVLLGWAVHEPSRAPSMDYLLKRRAEDFFGAELGVTVPENEAAWNALLDAYGFLFMDELDLVLLDGVRNGFFDSSLVTKHALELDKKAKSAELDSSFQHAWRMYHDSFADDQEEVLKAIYQSFIDDVHNITPLNLNGTVTLFKELGRPDQAKEIIQHYVASRGEERELFNLRKHLFMAEVTDPEVVGAFTDKYATYKQSRENPEAILSRMAGTNGWNPEDITILSSLSVDEYYSIFKRSKGHDLHQVLGACLQFDNIGNASAEMREISKMAKSALRQIGEESPINARRVKRYGIEVGAAETEAPSREDGSTETGG